MNDSNEEVMTLADAATFVKLDGRLLRRAIRRDALRAALVPGRAGFRIMRSDLIEWTRDGMHGVEPYTDEEKQHYKDEEEAA